MTLEFFKLKEQPFAASPNARFLYLSSTHREALASLLRTLQADRGLVTLVAPPGLGKTTLLFHFLNSFGAKVATVYISQAAQTPVHLLRAILADLGVREVSENLAGMIAQLKALATEEQRLGKRVVVVIDDAQNLDTTAFDLLRRVSSLATAGRPLVQFVLCGQPMLSDKLASIKPLHGMLRGAPVAHLEPFAEPEIALYLDHRLRTAGYARPAPLFTSEAAALVAGYSHGNPRVINSLCSEALLAAYGCMREHIAGEIVHEAAATLNLTKPKQESNVRKPSSAPMPSELVTLQPALATDGVSSAQSGPELPVKDMETVVSSSFLAAPSALAPPPSAVESALKSMTPERVAAAPTEHPRVPELPSEDESASERALPLLAAVEPEGPVPAPSAQVSAQVPADLENSSVSAHPQLDSLKTAFGEKEEAMEQPGSLVTPLLMPRKESTNVSPSPAAPPANAPESIVSQRAVGSATERPNGPEDSPENSLRSSAQQPRAKTVGAEGEIVPPKVRPPAARPTHAPPTLVSDEKSVAVSRGHSTGRAQRTAWSRSRAKKKTAVSSPTRFEPKGTPAGSTPWWLVRPARTAQRPVVPVSAHASAPLAVETPASVQVEMVPAAQQEPVASQAEKAENGRREFHVRWFQAASQLSKQNTGRARRWSKENTGRARRALVAHSFPNSGIAALLLFAVTGLVFGMYRSKTYRASEHVIAASPVVQPAASGNQAEQALAKVGKTIALKAAPSTMPLDENAAVNQSSAHDLKGMDLNSALQALSDQKHREQQDRLRRAHDNE